MVLGFLVRHELERLRDVRRVSGLCGQVAGHPVLRLGLRGVCPELAVVAMALSEDRQWNRCSNLLKLEDDSIIPTRLLHRDSLD